MEEVAEGSKEASGPPENQENMVSTQACEDFNEDIEERMLSLQVDLTTSVTNILTAADAKESMRRAELEEARRIRLERMMNDTKSSQEKFEEITRGWAMAEEKAIPQELQKALNDQQQLCNAVLEDKQKLINDLQQELRVRDEHFVKDLRTQEAELSLTFERMQDQIKTLTKAYNEELAEFVRIHQQEREDLLTQDMAELEGSLEELSVKEEERRQERANAVKEMEPISHNMILKSLEESLRRAKNPKLQALHTQQWRMKCSLGLNQLKGEMQKHELANQTSKLSSSKRKFISAQAELKKLQTKYSNEKKSFTKKSEYLSKDYTRKLHQSERIEKKIKHFAVADARQYEEMWQTLNGEMKQLVERVLLIDRQICEQVLGLPWEKPSVEFMDLSGPFQPQTRSWKPPCQAVSQPCHNREALESGHRLEDGLEETDSRDTEMYNKGAAVLSKSGAEMEEGKLSTETLKKVMEVLSDETGFLQENKPLKLLDPIEQVAKLGSLLSPFGIDEGDVPKVAHFLLKYSDEQRKLREDACVEPGESSDKATTPLTSELLDPNRVLPALKSFLEQCKRSRESSTRQHPSFHETWDASGSKAYWERLGNIIPEDKVKLWDAAEEALNQQLVIQTEISELLTETESLKQQNSELRRLLERSLNST